MVVTAVRADIRMHEADNLPGGELLVCTLLELLEYAHAPLRVHQLLIRELHIRHL